MLLNMHGLGVPNLKNRLGTLEELFDLLWENPTPDSNDNEVVDFYADLDKYLLFVIFFKSRNTNGGIDREFMQISFAQRSSDDISTISNPSEIIDMSGNSQTNSAMYLSFINISGAISPNNMIIESNNGYYDFRNETFDNSFMSSFANRKSVVLQIYGLRADAGVNS